MCIPKRVSILASMLELNKAFNKDSMKYRTIFLTVVVIIVALSLHGCFGGKGGSPTFGRDVTVLINPVFCDFSAEADLRKVTGEEKQKMLDWYEQINIIIEIDNPEIPTEPPVPSIH